MGIRDREEIYPVCAGADRDIEPSIGLRHPEKPPCHPNSALSQSGGGLWTEGGLVEKLEVQSRGILNLASQQGRERIETTLPPPRFKPPM